MKISTEVLAGDIGAVLGLKNPLPAIPFAMLRNVILLENITFPEPVISVAIEPKTTADQDKMGDALRKLSEEDPTFRVRSDEDTGRRLSPGWVSCTWKCWSTACCVNSACRRAVGRPQVSYRESITLPVERAEYRYVKQTGGHGQYGHVVLELQPGEPGSGIVFENKIIGGVIPGNTSQVLKKACVKLRRLACSPDIRSRISM